MKNAKYIGEILKIARHANDMTWTKVSELSGVSLIYISELERHKKENVSRSILEKLARAYGLSVEQIIELEAYYASLRDKNLKEEVIFRRTLMRTLELIEHNYLRKIEEKY